MFRCFVNLTVSNLMSTCCFWSTQKPEKWRRFLEVFAFRQYPVLDAPQKGLNEATEEQRKHALAVAIATAAAAEAAVAAANAAAEVVRLTSNPHELGRRKQYFAAIRIQSAYRGHLARKALSALKGIVKLQAVVRGELTRRSVVKTLSSMFLLTKAQPQLRQRDVRPLLDYLNHGEKRPSLSQKEGVKPEERKASVQRPQKLGFELGFKGRHGKLVLQRQEAVAKRERMKQYSFSHRWTGTTEAESHLQTGNGGGIKFTFSLPRRSCHVKQNQLEKMIFAELSSFPTYMAATSAKAKSRSLSTPKAKAEVIRDILWRTFSSWAFFGVHLTVK
ncbi:UNVERIFIED_CONTAM: protein IQ-DOMAIN 14 [Sesamum radiatum]|uniref:Protein IQ-DOMAIN 14 n=1 Tax=Sesamum radiatum TaxID=300843 RepID=A0AAW2TKC5_SESRA